MRRISLYEVVQARGLWIAPMWRVDASHLIRLVLWRGTAGEELAYVGALSSVRPLHRAIACAIGFLQVNHKALHAFALMGANAEAQRISHWDEPSGPLASEHECCVGCPQ